MDRFLFGVVTGAIGLGIVSEMSTAPAEHQCEADRHVAKCELLWVPVTDSKGEVSE